MDDTMIREVAIKELKEDPFISRREFSIKHGVSEWVARNALKEARQRPIGPRICTFDLETTSLIGDYATVLCGSIIDHATGIVTTYRTDETKQKDMTDDSETVRLVRDELESYDIIMGWYSKGFDVSMLNTRLIANGHNKLPNHLHYDACFAYRGWHGLKPRSSKLKVVAEFYQLGERKMDVDIQVWRSAAVGDKEAMDILVDRCESDVRVTAEVIAKTFRNGFVKCISRYA